jgi:hypothetical protein
MRLFALTLSVAAAIVLGSCAKESNPITPTPAAKYFPMAVGNAWAFSTSALDSMGMKVPGTDVTTVDSIVAEITFQGRTAYAMNHYQSDSLVASDTVALDADGNFLQWQDTSANEGRGMWMTMAHFNETTVGKNVTITTPVRLALDLGGGPTPVSGAGTFSETYKGTSSIAVPAGTFSARQHLDSMLIDFTYMGFAVTAIRTNSAFYALGRGLVNQTTMTIANTPFGMQIDGEHRELVRYHVK